MDKTKVKRILFITLSNIGDIVLTTPVLKVLSKNFPEARLDVMVGPNGIELFKKDPAVSEVISYNKHASVHEKRRLVTKLRREKYDLIVDMRNSLFPFLLGAKYRTSLIRIPPKSVKHKKEEHLWKLSSIGMTLDAEDTSLYIHIPKEDHEYIEKIISALDKKKPVIAVSPGAKSDIKRWPKEKYTKLMEKLIKELGAQIIMVGDKRDSVLVKDILASSGDDIKDLTGATNLTQLASLLGKADLLITNDSAPLHIAGAVNTKVLAIFGPTDPKAYGPMGGEDRVLKKKLHCSPCGKAQCEFEHECMKDLEVSEVFNAARKILKT